MWKKSSSEKIPLKEKQKKIRKMCVCKWENVIFRHRKRKEDEDIKENSTSSIM